MYVSLEVGLPSAWSSHQCMSIDVVAIKTYGLSLSVGYKTGKLNNIVGYLPLGHCSLSSNISSLGLDSTKLVIWSQ
jgi:hypothetical protein